MSPTTLECEIAVIGGGFGGVAAALSAAEAGRRVVLTEATDWIGGQVTSQLVAPLDEHYHIERFGGTRSYYRYREGVREAYRRAYPAVRGVTRLNPGSGWVSDLCHEPRVALQVLEDLLRPHVERGLIQILRQHTPVQAVMRGGRILRVILQGPERADGQPPERVDLGAQIFLDATELGDLLPLTGAEYVCGAEAVESTGEPHASQDGPHPERVQSFTWCFMVEYRPGENHTIRKPQNYDFYRESQPFSLVLRDKGSGSDTGGFRRFRMFEGELPFWTYRRVFDAGQLVPGAFAHGVKSTRDIAVINWDSNDYYKESLIDRSAAQKARVLREARRLSLSFLYWLQTEAPHDNDAGRGFPGLRLLPEAAGTSDGLAKAPYIRESRRVLGFKRVLEQDIIAGDARTASGSSARARNFADTVGVGWYPLDLHRCAGDPVGGAEERIDLPPSLPFQIPLGAMLSPTVTNLVAAAKNISTTHITNGAYRLQPVEWAIGEAAGALAAHSLDRRESLRLVLESPDHLRAFQQTLLARGIPLIWTTDLSPADIGFAAIQSVLLAAAAGQPDLMPEQSLRHTRLEILPDDLLSRSEGAWLLERLPRAKDNAWLQTLLEGWKNAPLGPFTGKDWSVACTALEIGSAEDGEYPTLRRVCEKLKEFV